MKITKELSIDTEYDNYIPFIATITNSLLESKIYYLNRMRDFNEFKNICESDKIINLQVLLAVLLLRNIFHWISIYIL